MSNGNGQSGLAYVLRDMETASKRMDQATSRLTNARLPDFTACPAGGEEYHAAMAESTHALSSGVAALLRYQSIQVQRDIDQVSGRHDHRSDLPEIKTRFFSARGAAAMWPAVLLAIVIALIVVLK